MERAPEVVAEKSPIVSVRDSVGMGFVYESRL
jgi:hypothetical protein